MTRTFECQVQQFAGSFFMVITISTTWDKGKHGSWWTSQPALLEAKNWEEAGPEAQRKFLAVRKAILGEGETSGDAVHDV
jgi:hypothetical protein